MKVLIGCKINRTKMVDEHGIVKELVKPQGIITTEK